MTEASDAGKLHLLSKLTSSTDSSCQTDVTCRYITDAVQWSELVTRVPFPHVTQCYAYGEGKRANGWTIARVVFEVRGKVVALCQILEWRICGIRVASRVNRGPMFIDPFPNPSLITGVYRLLRSRWGTALNGLMVITPALCESEESKELLSQAGYWRRPVPGWWSAHIDLRPSEEKIFSSFSATFRNLYRRAERQGVTCEITNSADAIDWLIRRYSGHIEQYGVKCPDLNFFRTFAEVAGDKFFVLRAMYNGEAVGGAALMSCGSVTEYSAAWNSPSARDLNLGYFLLWNAMREAKAARSYDLRRRWCFRIRDWFLKI